MDDMERSPDSVEWEDQLIWWGVTAGLYFAVISARTEYDAVIRALEERKKARLPEFNMAWATAYPPNIQTELNEVLPEGTEVFTIETGQQYLHPELLIDELRAKSSIS